MPQGERIGIFGGTFDPIHNAHIAMARAALEQAKLARVLLVVAARPPHKRHATIATPQERLRMVEAAVAAEPRMEASGIELQREGPSYTAHTLRELESQLPDARFYLIIGMDSLLDLPRWKEPAEILHRARLLVVPRPGEPPEIPAELNGTYDLLDFSPMDVSSTDIRDRLARGDSITGLVPPAVEQLILDEGLYDAGIKHRAGQ